MALNWKRNINSFFDASFWQNFLSNALATLLGALLGIPNALGLDRKLAKQRDLDEEKKQEEVAHERKRKVLSLLKEELNENKQFIETLLEKQDTQPSVVVYSGMKKVL